MTVYSVRLSKRNSLASGLPDALRGIIGFGVLVAASVYRCREIGLWREIVE